MSTTSSPNPMALRRRLALSVAALAVAGGLAVAGTPAVAAQGPGDPGQRIQVRDRPSGFAPGVMGWIVDEFRPV